MSLSFAVIHISNFFTEFAKPVTLFAKRSNYLLNKELKFTRTKQ